MILEHFLPDEVKNAYFNGVVINGEHLILSEVVAVSRYGAPVLLDYRVEDKVRKCREYVETAAGQASDPDLPESEKADALIYGVTTGFGNLKNFPITSLAEAEQLQENILHSHAVGVGDYLHTEIVRAMMLLRANAFARGHSGVRYELIQLLIELLNNSIHPLIPEQGSVGASGDLCPLAHLALVLIGKGEVRVERPADLNGEWSLVALASGGEALDAIQDELKKKNIPYPFKLSYKEGLALTNGTNAMTAIGILGAFDAINLIKQADIAGAMTLEAVAGRSRAFDPKVHELRPHAGQIQCARNIRKLIQGSKLIDQSGQVQDSYCVRCIPQVHGASWDTFSYVKKVLQTEMNAVTDNPLFFDNDPDVMDGKIYRREYSAGNFHGQPIALAMDFLAIALAEIGSISERRIQKLLDAHHNNGLPLNLAVNPGLNSGLMMLQYTAAALVSENKVLAHPASVDSIPTSANAEDHVSMGTLAARKATKILEHVQNIIAIELICAAQALDFRLGQLRPVANARVLADQVQKIHRSLAQDSARSTVISEPIITAVLKTQKNLQQIQIKNLSELGAGTKLVYELIRAHIPAVDSDEKQDLFTFIDQANELIRSGQIIQAFELKLGALYLEIEFGLN